MNFSCKQQSKHKSLAWKICFSQDLAANHVIFNSNKLNSNTILNFIVPN